MRILTTYTNCSLGGMTTVYRTRCLQNQDTQFDFVFTNNAGGRVAYEKLPNATLRIVKSSRLADYINFCISKFQYHEIRITGNPELVSNLSPSDSTSVIYEFHSPDKKILQRELEKIDSSRVDEFWVPSSWAKNFIHSLSPRKKHLTIRVKPNLVDTVNFQPKGKTFPVKWQSGIPVLWIGRLENTQKNYLDFLRTISLLPDYYFGVVIFSLESMPDRMERFLGHASQLGVLNRLRIYGNIPQESVASLHRTVRDWGGVFYSTSLSESFGYAVYEAALCGCPVVSYDVGPLTEHLVDGITFVPVGDIIAACDSIQSLTVRKEL